MIDVEFRNISKTYNPGLFKKKVLAVDQLNLRIPQGQVFGLIGPNGAGKSTTIRMLLGLIRPSQGTILFRGAPLDITTMQHEVGYLPENPYLYDHLTLRELLAFCGTTSGLSRTVTTQRGDALLQRLELTAAAKRPLRSFSKGMLQRAGICFALLHDPALVILDEPMSGLDPLGRKMVFDLVMELKERGKTIFFCSHILSDVERLCDRIGIMVGGRLVDEISAADFAQQLKATVALELDGCSVALRDRLTPLVEAVEVKNERHTVTLLPGNLYPVIELISEHGATVVSCQSAQVPLESHFFRVVKGAAQ
ncbi:MAG: ABC transporter ATP-binding protein [Desulfuromonadaceae bacterium]|nr:ABC transporter ATP-binding protein [Desulfuromonadaceae bacterium]